MMEENELKALVSLLDDDDKQISSHVEEKILSIGNKVIPFLEKEWESTFNPIVQQRIEELIHTLQYDLVKERLKDWYASKDQDLLTGMMGSKPIKMGASTVAPNIAITCCRPMTALAP